MKRIFVFLAIIGFGAVCSLDLQAQEVPEEDVLTFSVYMNRVINSNIEYLAENTMWTLPVPRTGGPRFPRSGIGNQLRQQPNWSLQWGTMGSALTYTLELGGKRRARRFGAE